MYRLMSVLMISVVGLCFAPPPKTQRQAQVKPDKKVSPPLTLPDLLEAIDAQADGLDMDPEALVRERSVTFKASPELVTVLRDYATRDKKLNADKLLDLIPKIQVPPPPEPATAGPLTITCKPVDCNVIVNDRFYGMSSKGTQSVTKLPPGVAKFELFADGYKGKTQTLMLSEGRPEQRTVVLEPTAAHQNKDAQDALLATVNALGGFTGIDAIEQQAGNGKVELKSKGLRSGPWTFSLGPSVSGRSFSLVEGKAVCAISLSNEGAKADCKTWKKNPPEPETANAAMMLRETLVSRVLANFLKGDLALTTAGGKTVLESRGASTTCKLTLDENHLPISFVEISNDGASTPRQIDFAEFGEYNSLHYPRKITMTRTAPSDATAIFTLTLGAPAMPPRK
jgi:hypothetical protein